MIPHYKSKFNKKLFFLITDNLYENSKQFVNSKKDSFQKDLYKKGIGKIVWNGQTEPQG